MCGQLKAKYPKWKEQCGLHMVVADDGTTEWVLKEDMAEFKKRGATMLHGQPAVTNVASSSQRAREAEARAEAAEAKAAEAKAEAEGKIAEAVARAAAAEQVPMPELVIMPLMMLNPSSN